eukprot:9437259-Karenia_brevis.AAC.1
MASDSDPLIGIPFEDDVPLHDGDLDMDLDLCSEILVDENVLPTDESYNFNMVAEHDRESDTSQSKGIPMKKEFWCQMKMFMERM